MVDFNFEGQGKIKLIGRAWDIDVPKAHVLIIHGFGEHSGRYSGMAEYFNSKNIAVSSFDNRGHGRSEGRRGHVASWAEFREDTKAGVAVVSRRLPTVPLFILGHSLGGTIVLDYLLSADQPPRGAIVSAPALGTPGVSPLMMFMGRLMSTLWPSFSMEAGLDTANLSRAEGVAEEYMADPLVHGRGTARLSTELSRVQKRIFERAGTLAAPLLLCYGSDDAIAPHEPIEKFFEAAGGEDKVLQVFEGAYHEIHNDIIRDEVYALYAEWMLARV